MSRSYLIKLKLFSTHIKNSFYCIPHFCSSMTSTSRQLTLKSRTFPGFEQVFMKSRTFPGPGGTHVKFPYFSRTRGNHVSVPKSTVTLFTPDKHQFQTHPNITLEDTQLPLERSHKILRVIMDPFLSFHKHCNYVSDRIDKRNRHRRTYFTADLQRIGEIYRKLCSTHTSDSSVKKIQTVQNAALRTATRAHKMTSIDHLHQGSLTLKAKDLSDMLSAQYLVNCLEEDHVCHSITTQEQRPMKETLHSRHHSTVLPRLDASRKESHQNLYTHAVHSLIQLLGNNRVLKEHPPPSIGRVAETEPKTKMHSFTTTVRTLPSIAGLQA